MANLIKRSTEVKSYTVDWAEETTDVSANISTSTFTAPTGLTVVSNTETTSTATVTLSGGRHRVPYDVENEIVTDTGQTLSKIFTVEIDDYAAC